MKVHAILRTGDLLIHQMNILYMQNDSHIQAGKLALARSPMRVKIWPGEWKTGLGKWNFV